MIFGMPRAVFPALGVGLFGGGAGVVGLLYAAPGAGALVGSLFTGWCSRVRHQGRAIAACVVIWGSTIALFGMIPVLWIGLSLLALAGAADVVSAVFRQAVQQRTVPEHLQGRLSGTFFAVVAGGPASATPRPAWPRPSAARSSPCGRGGLACVAGVGVLLWRVPELWRDRGGGQALSRRPRPRPSARSPPSWARASPLRGESPVGRNRDTTVRPVTPNWPGGPPPGWYPDPAGLKAWRWWDGYSWTQFASDPSEPPGPSTAPGPGFTGTRCRRGDTRGHPGPLGPRPIRGRDEGRSVGEAGAGWLPGRHRRGHPGGVGGQL